MTQGERIPHRGGTHGGVEDNLDVARQHRIDDMWAALHDLVDAGCRNAGPGQRVGGATGGQNLEPDFDQIAARVMAGEPLSDFGLRPVHLDHVAVKEAVFPFARFPGVDVVLGPEMKSTGEVMGIDRDFGRAFAKSQLGAGVDLPLSGTVFVSVRDEDKQAFIEICRSLVDLGFSVIATGGTTKALNEAGVSATRVNKVMEGRPHAVDEMLSGGIQLVFNTAKGAGAITDSFSLRHTALTNKIPYYTTVSGSRAAVQAIAALQRDMLGVRTLQDFIADIAG